MKYLVITGESGFEYIEGERIPEKENGDLFDKKPDAMKYISNNFKAK